MCDIGSSPPWVEANCPGWKLTRITPGPSTEAGQSRLSSSLRTIMTGDAVLRHPGKAGARPRTDSREGATARIGLRCLLPSPFPPAGSAAGSSAMRRRSRQPSPGAERSLPAKLDLARPGLAGHRALYAEAILPPSSGHSSGRSHRVIVAHRLLPISALLSRTRQVSGVSVICHGSDVWRSPGDPRARLERWLMRQRNVRIVTASSFTAGSLLLFAGQAAILPPGLSRVWFSELVAAIDAAAQRDHDPRVGHRGNDGLQALLRLAGQGSSHS